MTTIPVFVQLPNKPDTRRRVGEWSGKTLDYEVAAMSGWARLDDIVEIKRRVQHGEPIWLIVATATISEPVRTRLFVSRPSTEDFEEIDAKLEKRLEMIGYTCDGSGHGFGMRDLDFTSNDRATVDYTCRDFWEEFRKEIAALARCAVDDVSVYIQQAEAA